MTSLRLILDWDMVMEHYVREYECGPVIEPETLPLSKATVNALWARYSRWSTPLFGEEVETYTEADRAADLDELEREGRELWARVQRELGPSYRVHYYSETLHQTLAA